MPTMPIKDGEAQTRALEIVNSQAGNIVPCSQPLVNGNPIATSNPMPVAMAGAATAAAQATSNLALGAPDDVEAAGNGSVIALLKRLRSLLAGVLTVRVQGGVGTSWAAGQPDVATLGTRWNNRLQTCRQKAFAEGCA